MTRSLDFTACDLPCEHPCWRRLTKEEIEWLEKNPNQQAYTLVCIEKQANDVADNIIQTNCDICGKEITGVENFINAGDKVVCSEECMRESYFKDYVQHCEIGMSIDDISEIKKN